MTNKIFLGGTCANTTWRDELIRVIQVPYFNPVVKDWTLECQIEENYQKANLCNIHLYVITKEMQGVYSIAEVVESVMTSSKVTILHIIPTDFESHQLKSLRATVDLVRSKGGIAYIDQELNRTARVLNNCFSDGI